MEFFLVLCMMGVMACAVYLMPPPRKKGSVIALCLLLSAFIVGTLWSYRVLDLKQQAEYSHRSIGIWSF